MRQFHGIWVICLLSNLACLWTTKVEARGSSCSKVLGIGTPSKPEFPAQGSAPQICISSKTCCTSQMESTLRRKAVTQMKTMIRRKLDGRIQSAKSLREDIKGYFQNIVQDGYQQSLQFLGQSHVNLSRAGGPLLATFFTKVEQSIEDENVNITDVVFQFFRDSFPLLYQYASGRPQRLAGAYEKCLKDRLVEIRPFGDHPTRISQSLIDVLKPVHVFLESLKFATKIMEGSKQLGFTTGCDPVLLQMTFCSLCNGYKETLKPCNSYCLDVLEKCLSPTIQLQKHWQVYFNALDLLATSLASSTNAETVISTVYRDLSTAVVEVLAQVNQVKLEAFKYCGQPQFVQGGAIPPRPTPTKKPTSSNHLRTSIGAKMESAKSKMTLLDTLFGELPNAICVTDGLAAKNDRRVAPGNCWNGTTKASYTGPLSAPESSFQIVTSDMSKITSLVSEMKETIKLMKRHTKDEDGGEGSASGDSNVLGGSGGCDDDDDDCGSGGSGNNGNTVDRKGGAKKDDDIYIAEPSPSNPPENPKVQGGGSSANAKKGAKGGAKTTTRINSSVLSFLAMGVVLLLRL